MDQHCTEKAEIMGVSKGRERAQKLKAGLWASNKARNTREVMFASPIIRTGENILKKYSPTLYFPSSKHVRIQQYKTIVLTPWTTSKYIKAMLITG